MKEEEKEKEKKGGGGGVKHIRVVGGACKGESDCVFCQSKSRY